MKKKNFLMCLGVIILLSIFQGMTSCTDGETNNLEVKSRSESSQNDYNSMRKELEMEYAQLQEELCIRLGIPYDSSLTPAQFVESLDSIQAENLKNQLPIIGIVHPDDSDNGLDLTEEVAAREIYQDYLSKRMYNETENIEDYLTENQSINNALIFGAAQFDAFFGDVAVLNDPYPETEEMTMLQRCELNLCLGIGGLVFFTAAGADFLTITCSFLL